MLMCCMLQSPLITTMWMGTINCTLLPTVTFVVDTYGVCQKYSGAEIAQFLLYSIFCIISTVLGPAWFDALDVFHFFSWPLSYGWQLTLLTYALMVLYMGTVHSANFWWYKRNQRCQVVPYK